ncbi:MAG: DNA helicase RecQ [Candidatus Poribacteria bacterium]|nr:DNA helicase RecQ [Candidatus Poribacteria bacterium]
MRVLIVAKTRMGAGACIGAITETGESVRLVPYNADPHDGANNEYNVGDIWEITAEPVPETALIPPHNENIIVREKHRLRITKETKSLVSTIELLMPPKTGHPRELYEGLLKSTGSGSLYIAVDGDIPSYSTMFWRPDQPLTRDTEGRRIRYRYPTKNGGYTLTFVGFQEPLETIPAGTLLRVSLAHRWRPKDQPDAEERHYVQISGWFSEEIEQGEPEQPKKQEQPSAPTPKQTPLEILTNIFGHEQFRPFQEIIINHILKRQDALIVLPTGGGKSLCYQLPALMFEGVTVVVSPLISLMQDQVMQLQNRGIRAAFLNHTVGNTEYVATMQQVRQGEIKLLYLAPETLVRPEILVMLDDSDVACLAIDEAHCISEWGHDFRQEYRQLVSIRERFKNAVCVALTATATPRVQNDIKKLLKFDEENEFIGSFDRENLFIAVEPKVESLEQTLAFLNRHRGESGIIYCQTKKQVESLCRNLIARRISVRPYHADLDNATRQQNQEAFIKGDIQVIVATIAFGMGIDKADVRFVLHAGLPKEPESYYQEIGRSGRDGLPAECLLLFSYGDVDTINHFIDQGAESEKQGRRERSQTLVSWATSIACRRKVLLTYFGEQYEQQNCGMCDNCRKSEIEQVDLTVPAQKFLSCVIRTEELFGEAYIIDILRESKRKKILENRHNELSTYGIGMEYSKTQWRYLSHQFLQQELLARDPQHGSLRVTQNGWRVLNGGDQFSGFSVASVHHLTSEVLTEYDPELFKLLQIQRDSIAEAEGVHPHAVFHDKALQAMATYFPTSEESFKVMPSVGPAKTEKYGEVFLPIIRTYRTEHETKPVAHSIEALNTDPPTSAESNAHALELFEQLRDKRKTVADKEEVRAFRVFSDKILKEMVTYFPRTREAFRQIRGIGPTKTEKYAEDFLPIIRAYCEEHSIE